MFHPLDGQKHHQHEPAHNGQHGDPCFFRPHFIQHGQHYRVEQQARPGGHTGGHQEAAPVLHAAQGRGESAHGQGEDQPYQHHQQGKEIPGCHHSIAPHWEGEGVHVPFSPGVQREQGQGDHGGNQGKKPGEKGHVPHPHQRHPAVDHCGDDIDLDLPAQAQQILDEQSHHDRVPLSINTMISSRDTGSTVSLGYLRRKAALSRMRASVEYSPWRTAST